MTDKPPLIESYHLLSYDEVDSTNSEAMRLAGSGCAHGAVIWARRQTRGRGRMGRHWASDEGNLFASILLNCDMPLIRLTELPFVTALAVHETIASIAGDEDKVRLKWPNDILLNGKKVGGVLVETIAATSIYGDAYWAVAGVGINVEHCPSEVKWPATSLREAGVEILSAKIVLSRFVPNFLRHYDTWMEKGFAPVRERWCELAWALGEKVTFDAGNERVSGIFTGIDETGSLCLQLPDGKTRVFMAGEMIPASRSELVEG